MNKKLREMAEAAADQLLDDLKWDAPELHQWKAADAIVRVAMRYAAEEDASTHGEIEGLIAQVSHYRADNARLAAEVEQWKACSNGNHYPHCINNHNALLDEKRKQQIRAIDAEKERDDLRHDMQDAIDSNASHRGMRTEIGRELYSRINNYESQINGLIDEACAGANQVADLRRQLEEARKDYANSLKVVELTWREKLAGRLEAAASDWKVEWTEGDCDRCGTKTRDGVGAVHRCANCKTPKPAEPEHPDNALVDGLLNKALTKTWRKIHDPTPLSSADEAKARKEAEEILREPSVFEQGLRYQIKKTEKERDAENARLVAQENELESEIDRLRDVNTKLGTDGKRTCAFGRCESSEGPFYCEACHRSLIAENARLKKGADDMIDDAMKRDVEIDRLQRELNLTLTPRQANELVASKWKLQDTVKKIANDVRAMEWEFGEREKLAARLEAAAVDGKEEDKPLSIIGPNGPIPVIVDPNQREPFIFHYAPKPAEPEPCIKSPKVLGAEEYAAKHGGSVMDALDKVDLYGDVKPAEPEHPYLPCDHCGDEAVISADGTFCEDDSEACGSCGIPGIVRVSEDEEAWFDISQEQGARCTNKSCGDCWQQPKPEPEHPDNALVDGMLARARSKTSTPIKAAPEAKDDPEAVCGICDWRGPAGYIHHCEAWWCSHCKTAFQERDAARAEAEKLRTIITKIKGAMNDA